MFGLFEECDAVIGYEVGQVIILVAVIVFDTIAVHIQRVVIEAGIPYQANPLRPAWRDVLTIVVIEVLAEIS